MINRIIIISLLFLAPFPIIGQNEDKNIFEIGKPLTSCDCNLENLFNNWGPQFITNHDSIQLISWNFLETLEDSSRISFYSSTLGTPQHSGFSAEQKGSYSQIGDSVKEVNEFRIHPSKIEIPLGKENEYNQYILEAQIFFKSLLQFGDMVFEVKLKYVETEYTVYVYCRPGENKVFFDEGKFLSMKELYKSK